MKTAVRVFLIEKQKVLLFPTYRENDWKWKGLKMEGKLLGML
jgi:hypothetical protein